jgi:hypothetical protein
MAAGRRRRHLRRVGVIPFSVAMTPKGTFFCGELHRCLFRRRKPPGGVVGVGGWCAQPGTGWRLGSGLRTAHCQLHPRYLWLLLLRPTRPILLLTANAAGAAPDLLT